MLQFVCSGISSTGRRGRPQRRGQGPVRFVLVRGQLVAVVGQVHDVQHDILESGHATEQFPLFGQCRGKLRHVGVRVEVVSGNVYLLVEHDQYPDVALVGRLEIDRRYPFLISIARARIVLCLCCIRARWFVVGGKRAADTLVGVAIEPLLRS